MKITIEPDSNDVDYIRTHSQALNLIKSFLRALGISEADRERWDDVLWAEVDTSSNIEFKGMTCYLPESIERQQIWKYSTHLCDSGCLLLLNNSPFWAKMTKANLVDYLPSDLINLSYRDGMNHDLSHLFDRLNKLRSLDISNSMSLTNIIPLGNLKQLNSLNISNCDSISNINALEKLALLNSINLSGCKSVADIKPLKKLTKLISISLSGCKYLSDIMPLENLTQLKFLDLSGCDSISDITPLANLTQLTSINLSSCRSVSVISPLANLTQLTSIDLSICDSIFDITPLANLTQLTSINFSSCRSLSDISPLANLTQLTSINFSSCRSLSDIRPLANLKQLASICFYYCTSLKDLSPLVNLKKLTSINIRHCRSITDVSPFAKLEQFESLDFTACSSLCDISPLENLQNISSLIFNNCGSLRDIRPLATLKNLDFLDLSACPIININPLAQATSISQLYLSSCWFLDDISCIENLENLIHIEIDDCDSISDFSSIQALKKIKFVNIQDCLRINHFPDFKKLNYLEELKATIHPAIIIDILAHCAISRKDWDFVNNKSRDWLKEIELALKDTHPAAFDLATSLAIAFPHISYGLSERLCQILQNDPLLDYRPWKQLFLGVFQQMGFSTLQNLANTIAVSSWPRGAIGGLAAIGEQLIRLADGKEWFAGWVRAISAQHESNPSFLKPVAAPWCLALHCLGENMLLDQWIARFTDPDDSSALDAVFLEFGNHRLGLNDASGAFRHAIRIRATLVRDSLLADIASHYLETQQADQAAELLFLLSAEDKRAELSLKLADIPNFLDNRDNLHRLLAACGKNALAIGKLLAKAGMEEFALPEDDLETRKRSAMLIAQAVTAIGGLDPDSERKIRQVIESI
jgi:Leucine-rich repeat (LRR) protein